MIKAILLFLLVTVTQAVIRWFVAYWLDKRYK